MFINLNPNQNPNFDVVMKHFSLPHTDNTKAGMKPEEEERLKDFCKKYCPEVTEPEMISYIKTGQEIAEALSNKDTKLEDILVNINKNKEPNEKLTGAKAAVSLMWLFTAKTSQLDKLYTSGVMRLSDGQRVGEFLKLCGGSEVYGRISTHMKENLGATRGRITADNPQNGYDLRDEGLPAGKQTILFALQPDGTLFIKMEENGCPPFWKKGFRSLKNFREFVGHSIDFIVSRFRKEEKTGMTITHKEHVPKEVKKEFKKAMEFLFSTPKEAQEKYEQGAKFGLSKMTEILNQEKRNIERKVGELKNFKTDEKFKKNIESQKTEDFIFLNTLQETLEKKLSKPEGYKGEVKGDEVLLPQLSTEGYCFYNNEKSTR